MPPPFMLLVVVALVIGAALAVVAALGFGRKAGYLAAHAERPIGTLHGGVLAIRGRIKPVGSLRSPVSGIECVWYRYRVEEYQRGSVLSDRRDHYWTTVDSAERAVDFLVEDGRGEALVHVEGASFEVANAVTGASPGGGSGPGLLGGLLTVGGERRYDEALLKPGQEVHVIGGARPLHASPGTAVGSASLIFDQATAASVFIVSDRPPDRLASSFRLRAALGWIAALLLLGGAVYAWLKGSALT